MELKIINSETGKFEEKILSAGNEEYLVGRHLRCDIVLDGLDISRVHGRFVHRKGNFYYVDLGSTCGSWINNEEASINERRLLKANDTIRVGSFLIVVSSLSSGGAVVEEGDTRFPASDSGSRLWRKGSIEVTCKRIIRETDDTKTFVLASESGTLFSYKPGQFVNLNLTINGKSVKRAYSISSTPTRPHTLEITVKRLPASPDLPDVPPGLVSNWLHENVAPGSKLTLHGPSGKFTCCDRASEKLLFVSAGSGITPMMSMSRWMLDRASDKDIIFFHNARSPKDIIFKHELELLASRYENFKLVVAITRSPGEHPWMGYTGRLNETMLRSFAPDVCERVAYVCGPQGFMKQVKDTFAQLDFPMENYYQESFGSSKRKKSVSSEPAPAAPARPSGSDRTQIIEPAAQSKSSKPASKPANEKPSVAFANSQTELACPPDKSILELALEEGIEIEHACCAGACGNCQVKLLSGEHRYLQEPSFKPKAGHILTCVATAVGRVEVAA